MGAKGFPSAGATRADQRTPMPFSRIPQGDIISVIWRRHGRAKLLLMLVMASILNLGIADETARIYCGTWRGGGVVLCGSR
jgi:hypothetical protein